jgi:hypothetical protein
MAKLVLLSTGMTGRTHELKVDRTTIGRLEDNTFQIAEPSVSSHHCEILLRGEQVVVKDLNSTNGTFINGEKITESPLKPGQVLRLGQIEMRLDTGAPGEAPPPPPPAKTSTAPAASAPASTKKPIDQTLVMQRGVSLNELEQGTHGSGFGTKGTGFSKKDNKVNVIIVAACAFLGLIIVALLVYVFAIAGK